MNIYTADFESDNSDINIIEKYTSVWLWDICTVDDNYTHVTGFDVDSFFATLEKQGGGIYYFHNLKFDGDFILNYLLKSQYEYTNEKKLLRGQFYSLVNERNVFYMIKACIGYKGARRIIVEFRDSSKKIVGGVRKIAKDYGLPIQKGEIDYRMYHGDNYKATEREIEYVQIDTEIIARVLNEQYKNDMTHLTSSSDSYHAYKECIGNSRFRKLFPVVDYEIDIFVRKAYRGGCVQVNKKYRGVIITRPVYCYDVNSMYPARMVDSVLPYGKPVPFSGKPKFIKHLPLYIVEVEVCFDLKRGKRPTLLRRNLGFKKIEYVETTSGELERFVLTSVDLELMQTHYNIYEINYIRGYYFAGSKKLFTDYILPLYEKKSNSKGVVKLMSKILMNSLYGKFASNPKHIERIPYLDESGKTCFKNGEMRIEEPEYTAMGAFITSYARKTLFDVIDKIDDNFVYCDTDSVHSLVPIDFIEIDDNKLGAWSLEKIYVKSKYLAQKTYYGIKDNGDHDIKICGCPDNVKEFVTFDNFKIGASYDGKLLSKKVSGGTVLYESTFTIKER